MKIKGFFFLHRYKRSLEKKKDVLTRAHFMVIGRNMNSEAQALYGDW